MSAWEPPNYATGLITFVLLQVRIPRDGPQQQRALAWLAYSLNKNKKHHMSPGTALFMNDAATAYAVLALTETNER